MTWDVVVAGAGPAGSVAALVLAHAGRRVMLVDDVLSTKPKIGESLPGAARPLLQDLGLLSLVEKEPHLPSYGNVSAWGTEQLIATDFIRDPHGIGWHLDRAKFDLDLRQNAQKAGAVMQAAQVRSLTRQHKSWYVKLSNGKTHSTHWLVDATGRRSALAHNLGINRQRDDSLVALCGWAIPADNDLDSRALVESTPEGWWYTARLPNNLRVVVLHVDRKHAISILNQPETWLMMLSRTVHVSHVLSGAVFKDKPYGTEACGGRLDCFSGQNWLAVGDAALSFDPLSSQGMLNALYTGMRAGQTVHAALSGNDELVSTYEAQLENIRQAYLQHHRIFYQMEQRWLHNSFWTNRQM